METQALPSWVTILFSFSAVLSYDLGSFISSLAHVIVKQPLYSFNLSPSFSFIFIFKGGGCQVGGRGQDF